MQAKTRFRFLAVGLLAVLLAIIIACGEEATPTDEPATTDATTAPAATTTAAPAPAATTAAPAAPATGATATPSAAPEPAEPPAMMEPQGTLNVAMPEVGPAVFNGRDSAYATLRFLMTTVGESMFQNNLDGQTAGRLVKDWTIESAGDGVVYTFNLQPNVTWHQENGDWGQFNADDFLYNINNVTDDASVHAIKAGMLRAYKCDECTLTKIDDLTVTLERPSESFEVFWYTSSLPVPSSPSRARPTSTRWAKRKPAWSPSILGLGKSLTPNW